MTRPIAQTQEKAPVDLLLDEFIEDTEWRGYVHTPEDLAREVAGVAFDAMFGYEEPQYTIDAQTVGNVAGLIAQAENMADFDGVNAQAARLFAEQQPLQIAS